MYSFFNYCLLLHPFANLAKLHLACNFRKLKERKCSNINSIILYNILIINKLYINIYLIFLQIHPRPQKIACKMQDCKISAKKREKTWGIQIIVVTL